MTIILVSCIQHEKVAEDDKQFKLEFKLINKTATQTNFDKEAGQFSAAVRFTNMNGPTIKISPYLEYASKQSIYAFYIEAYDLQNKEINIEYPLTLSPDWFPFDLRNFSKGEVIRDTIYSSHIYKLSKRGTYRLRLVFNPSMCFNHKGEVAKDTIYSNWDTLTIK